MHNIQQCWILFECVQECCFIAEQMSAASKAGRITIRSDPAYSTELVKYDAGNKGEQRICQQ